MERYSTEVQLEVDSVTISVAPPITSDDLGLEALVEGV